ncbi:hypothetical protein ACKWTF_014587 [Chironomus riparius]
MKIVQIFSIIFLIGCVKSQGPIVIPDDSEVLEFTVQIERAALQANQQNIFLSVGTLLTLSHVLSPGHIFDFPFVNASNPNQIVIRFRGNQLGHGFRASPNLITRHQTADLAILRMTHRVDQQFRFAPRNRVDLTWNRFCTIYGFDIGQVSPTAQQLVGTSAMIRNSTDASCNTGFCAIGTVGQFSHCDGFIGSPVTCDGVSVAAIVIEDHFCALTTASATLFRLSDQTEWINTHTSGAKISTQSTVFGVILGALLMRFMA